MRRVVIPWIMGVHYLLVHHGTANKIKSSYIGWFITFGEQVALVLSTL